MDLFVVHVGEVRVMRECMGLSENILYVGCLFLP